MGDEEHNGDAGPAERPKRRKWLRRERAVKGGRIGRAGKVGFLGAGSGTRLALTNVRTLGRSTEKKIEVWEDFHRKTAEQMKAVLGQMKGAAMKLGQMASFIDTGMVPPEFTDLYHEVLAELRDAAPPMTMEQVAAVMEEDYNCPISEEFASFEEEPLASASIGQVHRAALFDGRRVIVKVQYPGVDDAIRADLKNAAAFAWMLPLFAPGMEVGPLVEETQRAVLEEIDYRLEARSQKRFADAYRGHPFIKIPEPVPELCGPRTLVVEEVLGTSFDEMCRRGDAERDRAGEIIFRFAFGTLYRFGFFNADTHPGNYAFLDDGRVAFYDFGAVKEVPGHVWADFVELAGWLMRGDVQALFDGCVRTGFVRRPEKVDPQRLYDWLMLGAGELIGFDRDLTVTPDLIAGVISATTDPRNDWFSVARWLNVHPESLMIGRMEVGIMAILGKLRATGNWHRMAREWVFHDPPATELGRRDAEFFASHQ